MYTHEMTPQEKWENATIANNFIFYKIMRNNPDVCQEFIERLLQIEIDHIDDLRIKLNDRSYKYFFIAENCDKLLDEKQKELLKLVKDNVSTDSFSSRILKLVSNAKKNSQWRHKYMEYERQRTYDLLAGEEKGRSEAKLEAAVIAVKDFNISPEVVAEKYCIPLEELKFKLSQNLDSSSDSE